MSSVPFKIFVVEDNDWYNRLLVHNLSLNPDFEVISFLNGWDCINNLDQNPDLVTLDFRLPDISGIEVLKKIKQQNYDTQVILISEQDDIEVVVELLKEGAYDYIVKSNDIKERLHNTILNIRKNVGLKKEITELKKEVQKKYTYNNLIIGESDAVKGVHELISKAITTNINVSVFGETGTGKELVAKAIHYNSNRKSNAFVAVNVSAVPSELVESELFGHEKGAFTGASFLRKGKFEEADGGTLFLDEIGDMDIQFQAKLLRALQEKEITRIGSNKKIKVDCRIITATHKNLALEVKNGNFRQDLFYRLLGFPIELPPLRERNNDVLILAKHFVKSFCSENNMAEKKLTTAAINKIKNYSFPGNIRELKSIIELAVTLSSTSEITEHDILFSSSEIIKNQSFNDLTLREYEMKIVKSYLQKYNNDVRLVAKKLDIGTATIYRMLKEMKQS
ncbi:MAG: sigma-54 dependent transcriptional regulator [Bacteroidales bacterium]|jgi:DNA-binding NtrC family response regulator|nr:sigma-54 dependent transcriptional regulator [Bacteroidales bacterium]